MTEEGSSSRRPLLFPLTAGPAQTFATSGSKGAFALWSLASLQRVRVFDGHFSYVYHALFLDENEVVSCSGDSSLRRWNVASGECLQIRGNGFVSIGYDKSLRFWSFDEAECVAMMTFDDELLDLCVSDTGRVLVACRGVVLDVEAPGGLIATDVPRPGNP